MSKVIPLRQKLSTVSKIHKMTEAMQIVAAAQIKAAQEKQKAAGHYKKHYARLAGRLGVNVVPQKTGANPPVLLYAFFSERGFCGGFNDKLAAVTRRFLAETKRDKKEIKIGLIGAKGSEMINAAGFPGACERVAKSLQGDQELANGCALSAYNLFRAGKAERVFMLFNEYVSMLDQTPKIFQLLPFDIGGEDLSEMLLIEPEEAAVREQVGINYAKALFYDALMQTRLGELSARLLTMRSAAENSKVMIEDLGIKLNKARQSMITIELSEIISSFEILSGGEA